MPIKMVRSVFHEVSAPTADLFDKMVAAGEECSFKTIQSLTDIINKAGVETDYGRKEILEILLYGFDREIPTLLIPNEDWSNHLKYGTHTFERGPVIPVVGRLTVKNVWRKLLKMVEDDLLYRVDKIFGFDVDEPPARGDEAARFADKLWRIVTADKESLLSSMGDELRFRERYSGQRAVKGALASFDLCMRSKIPELH